MPHNLKNRTLRAKVLNFAPVLVIMLFGLLAIISNAHLVEEHQHVVDFWSQKAVQYQAQSDPSFEAKLSHFMEDIQQAQTLLYASIIAMFLLACILTFLNVDKLQKLSVVNDENKANLKLLEARSAAIDASQDGIGIVSAEGNLMYMNPALLDLHGIPKDKKNEYIGKPWIDLYNEQGKNDIRDFVMPVLEREGVWRGESTLARKDGKMLIAEMTLTRLEDGGMIGTGRDMSAKKKAEYEHEQLQIQFYQAQKMEAVGRLAGGIAHDFNNILAAMNGYAEFLVEDLEKGSEQQQFALNIISAGKQARSLVDQMLAFSKRKGEEAHGLVDLSASLNEAISMMKASVPKTINLKANIEAEEVLIEGSASQISQLIMNLCVNARDAIKEDKGEIAVDLTIAEAGDTGWPHELVDELPDAEATPLTKIENLKPGQTRLTLNTLSRNHDYAILTVGDTGTGMSRTIMEKVFEPFFTTKSVDKGTGLGLSTVHGVIASHHAALLLESQTQEGTVFKVYFPLSGGDIDVDDEDEAEEEQDEKDRQYKILLVEDQDNVRGMMIKMLERLGHHVEIAEDGLVALNLIRTNPGLFDLIVTDHNMPKMTGLELVQQTSYDFPDLPFILVSGYSEEELQSIMAQEKSIKDILRKPVNKNELKDKILDVLQKAS